MLNNTHDFLFKTRDITSDVYESAKEAFSLSISELALLISAGTLIWRFWDKYRERSDKTLVDAWTNSILMPTCIVCFREFISEVDQKFGDILAQEISGTVPEWENEFRELFEWFSKKRTSIEARFNVIYVIDSNTYQKIQNSLDVIEDHLSDYFNTSNSHQANLKREDLIQNIRHNFYNTLNLASRSCFQLVNSGKVKKYLKAK